MNTGSYTVVVFESFPLLLVGVGLIFNGVATLVKAAVDYFNGKKKQEADHER